MTDTQGLAPPVDALDEGLLKHGLRTTLHLIRHGMQDYPRSGRPIGEIVDPPLSSIGERQLERLGERFAKVPLDAVYSSHLSRAYRTGQSVGAPWNLQPIVNKDLREYDIFRDLPPDNSPEDCLGADVVEQARERMVANLRWDSYPGSESSAEFRGRVDSALFGILAAHEDGHIAVACHGGVINAFLAVRLGIGQDMFFRAGHTSVTTVYVSGDRVVIERLNDRAHLDGEPELQTF